MGDGDSHCFGKSLIYGALVPTPGPVDASTYISLCLYSLMFRRVFGNIGLFNLITYQHLSEFSRYWLAVPAMNVQFVQGQLVAEACTWASIH